MVLLSSLSASFSALAHGKLGLSASVNLMYMVLIGSRWLISLVILDPTKLMLLTPWVLETYVLGNLINLIKDLENL